jgi:predicted TIM-barrel fold metal-dependent hydrolase
MKASLLPKVSADAHLNEPHDLWSSRAPRALRDAVPQRIRQSSDGAWTLVVGGAPVVGDAKSDEEERLDNEQRRGFARVEVRLDMMRSDGINAEMIYPTIGLYIYVIADGDTGAASCLIYNDWVQERLGGVSPRVRFAALVPTWDVDDAVAEVHRVAAWRSVGGLMLPLVADPSWNQPEWEPLWSAIEETGLPAVMHQGTGHDMIFYRGWGSPTANLLSTQSMAPRAAALLACSGVLERHPALHAVLVEVNAGWMAWAMSTLDEYYQAHAHWSKPKLAALPSEYLRLQVHATFQADPVAVHNMVLTGTDCLLWGNDYPHPESTFPGSGAVLDRLFENVDDEGAVREVISGNAVRLFGFDPGVLASRP